YAPMGEVNKGLPLMVLLHDNPYEGDKQDVRPFAMEMARRGVLVASLNYTRALDGQFDAFSASIADVFCFLDWLHLNAKALGLSLTGDEDGLIPVTSVSLCGVGLGGHLAATVLNVSGNRRMQEYWASSSLANYLQNPLPIAALVALAAPLCPRKLLDNILLGWVGKDLFGKEYRAHKGMDYLDFASNLSVDVPPVMLVTSQGDKYRRDNLLVRDALLKLGKSPMLLDNPAEEDKEHKLKGAFSALYPLWRTSKEVNDKIAAFVRALE
ncbi:MAG: hypothetical protein J5755_00615, partial [Clostridia bacterium]|nr:hypothetical protein [Clostridia bacterium]